MKNWEEQQRIILVKRTESVVLEFLEYPKYTQSSIQFCISVSFVSVHGILTRVLYQEKMRSANCSDKLLQKYSLDSFLVIVLRLRKLFPYISALRGNFGTIRKGPPLLTLFGLAYFVVSGI